MALDLMVNSAAIGMLPADCRIATSTCHFAAPRLIDETRHAREPTRAAAPAAPGRDPASHSRIIMRTRYRAGVCRTGPERTAAVYPSISGSTSLASLRSGGANLSRAAGRTGTSPHVRRLSRMPADWT